MGLNAKSLVARDLARDLQSYNNILSKLTLVQTWRIFDINKTLMFVPVDKDTLLYLKPIISNKFQNNMITKKETNTKTLARPRRKTPPSWAQVALLPKFQQPNATLRAPSDPVRSVRAVGRNQSLACLDPPCSPASLRNCGARSDKPLICWLRECRRATLRWWQHVYSGGGGPRLDWILRCQVAMSTAYFPGLWGWVLIFFFSFFFLV